MINITKKQFDAAYNQHLPNGWIKFAYKYFSNETEKKNMSLRNNLVFILLGLFFIGFFGTVFHIGRAIIGTITIIYSIILLVLVLYLFGVVIMNNLRVNKIRKILGISKTEYNDLVKKYY